MKLVLYFMGEAFLLPYNCIKEYLKIAQRICDDYNCNVELMLYGFKRVKVWSFKKRETYYPYSRERLERNGTLY